MQLQKKRTLDESGKTGRRRYSAPAATAKYRRGTVVGVDMGPEAIFMVKAERQANGFFTIQDWRKVPCAAAIQNEAAGLAAFLKTELNDFLAGDNYRSAAPALPPALVGSRRKHSRKHRAVSLWGCVDSAETEIRFLKVPPVGPRKMSGVVRWMAAKEMDLDKTRVVFDYFRLDTGTTQQPVNIMAYTAGLQAKQTRQKIFTQSGLAPAGLTLAPFALQNLFRNQSDAAAAAACLDIAADHSRILIFKGGRLALSRTVKTGLDSIVEDLREQGGQYQNLERSQLMRLLMRLPEACDVDSETFSDVTCIQTATRTVLDRLIRQLERTLDHYTTQLANEPVNRLYLVCTHPVHDLMTEMLAEQLALMVESLNPFELFGERLPEFQSQSAGILTPTEGAEFVTAAGLALSDNQHTPNLLYTFQEKDSDAAVRRINHVIFVIFLVLTGICTAVFIWQNARIQNQTAQVQHLQQQLAAFDADLTRETLERLLQQVQEQRSEGRAYSERYRLLAAISEIAALTPVEISLLAVELDLGSLQVEGGEARVDADSVNLKIEAFVNEHGRQGQKRFHGYIARLDSSPLFGQIEVIDDLKTPFLGNEVQYFTLHLKLATP